MTLNMAIWRADATSLTRLTASGIALESQLEDYIEKDPTLLGDKLLLIGRQVPTGHGGYIDLLAVDADGSVHVLELKRDRTPRDVVAQLLDYASWVAGLTHQEVVEIFDKYRSDVAFDEAFAECFGEAPPDELNANQLFTIVAASVDPATERIVKFLNEAFGVPINVVFFRHFDDGDSSYLARSWLVADESEASPRRAGTMQRTMETWNGRDWYVSFGDYPNGRRWEDARTYGFVSAGGNPWYSRTLRNLSEDARVFVLLPGRGYVGVGKVTGPARQFSEAEVTVDGAPHRLAELPLRGTYTHNSEGDTADTAEYVVPVAWEKTIPAEEAIWKPGMFANQNSACKLRKQFTIDTVLQWLGLPQEIET